jgi:hypothetical protein
LNDPYHRQRSLNLRDRKVDFPTRQKIHGKTIIVKKDALSVFC